MESGRRSCSLLLLLSVASLMLGSARGYDIYVGGRSGWVATPSESYGSWSGRLRFSVNDSLVFVYDKSVDSVLEVSSADYSTCSAASPITTLNSGRDSFKLTRSGPFYFITGNATHCQAGQKLLVVVLAIRSPPSSSTPAPTTPAPAPGSTTPTAPASAPASSTTPAPPASAPASSTTPTAPASSPAASTPSLAPASGPAPSSGPALAPSTASSPSPSSGPSLAPSSGSSPSPTSTGGSSGSSSPPSEPAPGASASSPPAPPTRSTATSVSVPTLFLAASLAGLLAGPILRP